jgi:hypothetical protein
LLKQSNQLKKNNSQNQTDSKENMSGGDRQDGSKKIKTDSKKQKKESKKNQNLQQYAAKRNKLGAKKRNTRKNTRKINKFASFCSISLHVVDFFAFCCSFDFCLTFWILFLIFLESVFDLFLSRPVSGSPRPTLF